MKVTLIATLFRMFERGLISIKMYAVDDVLCPGLPNVLLRRFFFYLNKFQG